MVKDSLVTKTQAKILQTLDFHEAVCGYYDKVNNFCSYKSSPTDCNHPSLRMRWISMPTVDEVIDWLRRKHNIIIYNKIEPFVDPADQTHKTILFRFGVKQCDTKHLGWNGRVNIGETRLSKNVYSLKREAVNIALKYILKSYGEHTESTESPSF